MSRPPRGFTLLEIMIAAAILAFALVPVMTQSQQTVVESADTQENIVARMYLMDIVERFRGSPLDELRSTLPTSRPDVPLGEEPDYIKNDSILSDRYKVLDELEALTAAGGSDAGKQGFEKLVNLSELVKLTGLAWYTDLGNNQYELVCEVRWQPANLKAEKSVVVKKILFR